MSTKEFGCFFCFDKSQSYSGLCPSCGRPIDISHFLRDLQLESYQTEDIVGRGFYGWTLRVTDGFQTSALKIIPLHRVADPNRQETEARALAACGRHRNIVLFQRSFKSEINCGDTNIAVICMVFDYVEGAVPLREFLLQQNTHLTRLDIHQILFGITSALQRMHARGLWHHDLHDDNILIRTVSSDENLQERFEPKLIDLGSATLFNNETAENAQRSDYIYLAKHIYTLVARFEQDCETRYGAADRTYSVHLRNLAHRLSDPNISRRNLEPSGILDELNRALTHSTIGSDYPSFQDMLENATSSLSDPLENTNALTLEPQDVSLLFRDSLRWLGRLDKSEPVIVVGPRGCGKTMLLRFLALTSQARPRTGESNLREVRERLAKTTSLGFLVSGGQLRTPFIRSSFKLLADKDVSLAEDFCREYLNSVFFANVLKTIAWLRREQLAEIADDEFSLLVTRLAQAFPSHRDNRPPTSVDDLAQGIDQHITALSNLQKPLNYCPTELSRDDTIAVLADCLQVLRYAKSRHILLLLDDYSVTVLPPIVQTAYNPVLFNLRPNVRIAISSEGEGPILTDSLNRKYKEGRELSFVNLGEVYFHAKELDGRNFIESILEARFQALGKGSMENLLALLGEHEREHNFGSYICDPGRPGDKRFYGFGLICRLCSGDVSFILELLRTLSKGRWGNDVSRLTPKAQDEIVKKFAQRQLHDLRRIADVGPHLHDIAQNLGSLIKGYLLDSCINKNSPDERIRIEIEGSGDLTAEAQRIHESLLRHSILISGGAGKNKTGLPTRKLFFRRMFSPCFPFSPNRGECIALTISQYQEWLLNPERIFHSTKANRTPPNPANLRLDLPD